MPAHKPEDVGRSQWELTGSGPDGSPVAMSGQGVEIARRQSDGTWRWAVDTPWGLGWAL